MVDHKTRRPVYSMIFSPLRMGAAAKTPRPWTRDLRTSRSSEARFSENFRARLRLRCLLFFFVDDRIGTKMNSESGPRSAFKDYGVIGSIYSKGRPDSLARSCKLTWRFVPPFVDCCLRTFISALVRYRGESWTASLRTPPRATMSRPPLVESMSPKPPGNK